MRYSGVRELVFTNTAQRRWAEASRRATQMRTMSPGSRVAKIQSGYVDFCWKGDTGPLKSMLIQVPAGTDPDRLVTSCRWDVAMIDGDFGEAPRVLQNSDLNEISYTNAGATPKSFFQCLIERAEATRRKRRNCLS